MMNKTNMEPNVPISKPFPKREIYIDEEKKVEIKKMIGIATPITRSRSLGIENLPSPSLAINQKKIDRVAPMEIKKPLLASSVIGMYGIKKKIERKIVAKRMTKDNLFKNITFFDSTVFLWLAKALCEGGENNN